MAIKRGFAEVFHDDQLVVALPALDVVTQSLRGLGVGVAQDTIERNEVLQLALIRDLKNLEAAVDTLRRDSDIGPQLDRIGQERRSRGQGDPALLDLLVNGVLIQLATQFPGWLVEIGKNYCPSNVRGYPHISGGGKGDPVPTEVPLGRLDFDRELTGRRRVRVGVLDTAMFPDPWLTGRYIAHPKDILDSRQDRFTVFDGHCAFVTSCILQQAPAAEIHVRSVLGSDGEGSAWDAAVAIAEMAQAGVDVVNLSFGEYRTHDDSAPLVLRTAVKRLGPDTVVVAAAGNNGDVDSLPARFVPPGLEPNSVSYPAALPDVVGVGALDRDGNWAAFTPRAAPWIRLLAPGVGLTGAYVRGTVLIEHRDGNGNLVDSEEVDFPGQAIWEGCSFAAAVVSGAIAAGTVPGRHGARQVLEELLRADPAGLDRGIRPADLTRSRPANRMRSRPAKPTRGRAADLTHTR